MSGGINILCARAFFSGCSARLQPNYPVRSTTNHGDTPYMNAKAKLSAMDFSTPTGFPYFPSTYCTPLKRHLRRVVGTCATVKHPLVESFEPSHWVSTIPTNRFMTTPTNPFSSKGVFWPWHKWSPSHQQTWLAVMSQTRLDDDFPKGHVQFRRKVGTDRLCFGRSISGP